MDDQEQKDSPIGEASLPLPQKDLPLPHESLPLPEKELPPPHEMLLRAPNFWEKHNPTKWVLIIIAMLLIIIPVGYVVMNQESLVPSQKSINPTEAPTPTAVVVPSTIKTYINKKYGYSFQYPSHGSPYSTWCTQSSNGYFAVSDHSLPLKIFENNTITYLASEYYFEATNEIVVNNGIFHKNCERITNSLDLINSSIDSYGIPIKSQIVENDTQLNAFITDRFGQYCTLDTKEQLNDGTYDVKVKDTGVSVGGIGRPLCPDIIYSIFYNPNTNVAVSIRMGHECLQGCKEISESFTFLKPSVSPSMSPAKEVIMCPMDAKVCPNGISVGRTGTSCEFPACP